MWWKGPVKLFCWDRKKPKKKKDIGFIKNVRAIENMKPTKHKRKCLAKHTHTHTHIARDYNSERVS